MELSFASAGIYALLGYAVVFFGLILLMAVITILGKIMTASAKKAAPAPAAAPAAPAAEPKAIGSAGQVALHGVPDRDAAMVMAIVAEQLGKPLNELRFISIKEVVKS